jgi:hypothetical protein
MSRSPSPTKRLYVLDDATMRQGQRTMLSHFSGRAAEFGAFNPEFGGSFLVDWDVALTAADAALPRAARAGTLKEDTEAVKTVMASARDQVQRLFYFVGEAYPGNAGRLAQYGKRDYNKARNNRDKMATLLLEAFEAATRDQAALAAKGWNATARAAFGELAPALALAMSTQQIQKGTNLENGQAYIGRQNTLYGYGQRVSAAAKIRFATEQSTLRLFRLTR